MPPWIRRKRDAPVLQGGMPYPYGLSEFPNWACARRLVRKRVRKRVDVGDDVFHRLFVDKAHCHPAHQHGGGVRGIAAARACFVLLKRAPRWVRLEFVEKTGEFVEKTGDFMGGS